MAKTSTTSLSVAVTGDGVAATYTPATAPMVNTAAPAGGPVDVTLAIGDTTIAVPTGAQGFVLVPPSASTVVKTLKGVGGDTGFAIALALPTMISLPASTTTILVNAASSEVVAIHWL